MELTRIFRLYLTIFLSAVRGSGLSHVTQQGHVSLGENCTQGGFTGPRRGSMMVSAVQKHLSCESPTSDHNQN